MNIKKYYVTLKILYVPRLCLYLHWCHVCFESNQKNNNSAFSLASLTWYSRVWGCRNCWITILPVLTCPEDSVVEQGPNLLCYAVRLSSPEVFATLIILNVWNSIADFSFLYISSVSLNDAWRLNSTVCHFFFTTPACDFVLERTYSADCDLNEDAPSF